MSDTRLDYRVVPPQVFVATSTGLTVTIQNPVERNQPVTLNDGDEIQIRFPQPGAADALTAVLPVTVTSTDPRFPAAIAGTGDYYVVTPFGFDGQTLQPGESFDVVWPSFAVVAATGTSTLTVDEFIGSGSGQRALTVGKVAQELNVVAWLRDLQVGLGQKTRLSWTSYGGAMVVVTGFQTGPDPNCPADYRFPGQKCFRVQGEPPYPGFTMVDVPPTAAQWTYVVRVYTGSGEFRETSVHLRQQSAYISGFGLPPNLTQPAAPVGATAPAQLSWRTLYTAQAYLTSPTGQLREPPNPANPVPVQPGVDAMNGASSWSQIPDTALYRLQATGFGSPATATVTFRILPVRLLYFKYTVMDAEGKLSDPRWAIDPADWRAIQQAGTADLLTFTLFQPGSRSEVRYLGAGDTTHPQVQYFAATPGEGGKQTLAWVTANVTALVLNPGAYQVPGDQIAKGSYEVTPSGTTDYVLEATAAGGEKVTSTLRVTAGS
jgi:hypothetical protein